MESNNTNEEFFIGASPLAEPHFDEEATLLSARRVVPLHEVEVEVEVRFRKRVLFGLAMACSLTMGALAATLIYKQRGNGQPTSISTAVPGAAGIAVDGTVSSPETAEEAGSASGALPEAGGPTVERKSGISVHRSAESTVVETKRQESLAQQREDREPGAERINARHLRRRSERQERRTFSGRQRKSADDLLRIREIFEGPSRP